MGVLLRVVGTDKLTLAVHQGEMARAEQLTTSGHKVAIALLFGDVEGTVWLFIALLT